MARRRRSSTSSRRRSYSPRRAGGRVSNARRSVARRSTRVNGRPQTVRLVIQSAPQQPVSPMVLPGGSELVMPGAPRPRRARF